MSFLGGLRLVGEEGEPPPRASSPEPTRVRIPFLAMTLAATFSLAPEVTRAAPAASGRAASASEATYAYDFQDAQIAQVADAILGDLGVRFSVDPSVTGRMSFRIDQRLTKAQLLEAFEVALAANNVAWSAAGIQLNERSRAWPADLRRRWTYAAALGAVGGYVF